jgi:hypothetical protein
MYESPDQEKPVYNAKGIETVRRDGCPAVAKVVLVMYEILFANHSGRVVSDMNYFHPLSHWGHGFKSHLSHSCLCAFLLCLCCPLCR